MPAKVYAEHTIAVLLELFCKEVVVVATSYQHVQKNDGIVSASVVRSANRHAVVGQESNFCRGGNLLSWRPLENGNAAAEENYRKQSESQSTRTIAHDENFVAADLNLCQNYVVEIFQQKTEVPPSYVKICFAFWKAIRNRFCSTNTYWKFHLSFIKSVLSPFRIVSVQKMRKTTMFERRIVMSM